MDDAEDVALKIDCNYLGKDVSMAIFIHNKKMYTVIEIPPEDNEYYYDADVYSFIYNVKYTK